MPERVPAGPQDVAAEPGDVAAYDLGHARGRRLDAGNGMGRIHVHHRGHDPVGLGLRPRSRHQLLDLGHERLGVTDPGQVIAAGELDVACAGDVLGHVSGVRHVDRHLVGSMKDHDRNPNRRQ